MKPVYPKNLPQNFLYLGNSKSNFLKPCLAFIFLSLYTLGSNAALGQILNIPDPNFKNALVNTLCADNNGDNQFETDADLNNDGEIEQSEALYVFSLKVSGQQIESLAGIEHFKNLSELNCAYNNLTELKLVDFPYLYNVFAPFNKLESLHIENDTNLYTLFCYDNLLTTDSFVLKNLKHLESLNCTNNLLSSFDATELIGLKDLFCSDNPITRLFLKNGNTQPWKLAFFANPALAYICCDDWQVAQLQNQTSQFGLTNCSINSYCSFVPGGKYYGLQLFSQYDNESDGCDANDPTPPGLGYDLSYNNSTGRFFPENTGAPILPLQAGEHLIKPFLAFPNYFSINPSSALITFPNTNDTLNQNFCLQKNGTHHDVGVVVSPISPARPGFDATYTLVYTNNGTEIENAALKFVFDDDRLDFISADLAPGTQSTGLLSWIINSLEPFESKKITVTLRCNSPAQIPPVNAGDTLVFRIHVDGIINEATPEDNTVTLNQIVVGSFDPNDKNCIQGNSIPISQVGKYVHYLIRFENTGTFQAENIVVKDILDKTVFDLTSLQITDASHPVVMRINNNQLEFIFENINLPFTEPGKHGYVAFKIKTLPTLVLGNHFSNSAEIYFDYNLPIITNTAKTTVVSNPLTGFHDTYPETYLQIDPNPATDFIILRGGNDVDHIEIFNAQGRRVMQPKLQNGQIDISPLPPGMYWVKVRSKDVEGSVIFLKKGRP